VIVKKIGVGKRRKTTKRDYVKSLINYVFGRTARAAADKVGYSGARNFISGTIEAQINEMLAVVDGAPRSSEPVSHWILSWQAGETPTAAQLEEAVDVFLDEFGLQKHLVLYACHQNTGNLHLHLVLNRIDPQNYRATKVNGGFDIEAGHRAIARIEQKQGWASSARARYAIDTRGVALRAFGTQNKTVDEKTGRLSEKRVEVETVAGDFGSAESRAKAVVAVLIDSPAVDGWTDWHCRLAESGIRYEKSGSGAVFFVGAVAIKASAVHRKASLLNRERQWGVYQSASDCGISPGLQPVSRTVIKPVPDDAAHWRMAEKKRRELAERAARTQLEVQQKYQRQQLQERQDAQRREIQARSWIKRGLELRALQSLMAYEQAAERAHFASTQRAEWQALATEMLRFGGGVMAGKGTGTTAADIRGFYPLAETGSSEVWYRDVWGRLAFVDVGERIYIYTNDPAAILGMLQLAIAKWGAVEVFGSDDFKRCCAEVARANGIALANPELQSYFTTTAQPGGEEEDYPCVLSHF